MWRPRRRHAPWWSVGVSFLLVVMAGAGLAYQQSIELPDGSEATIDWGYDAVTVKGFAGAPPDAVTATQGRQLARRGAIVDAQRRLLEVLGGVRVTSESLMLDYLVSDRVMTEVAGLVQGAIIVDEAWDTVLSEHAVTMEIRLSAARSIILPELPTLPENPDALPPPPEPIEIATPTGVIFDVRGLDPVPSLTFKVFAADGSEVVSAGSGSYVIGQAEGDDAPMAEFGGDDRVAEHPFMLRAIGLRPNEVDLVISNEDAARLQAHLQQRDFFGEGRALLVMN